MLNNGAHWGGGNVDGFYINARCRVRVGIDGTVSDDCTYWAYGPTWHKVQDDETATLRKYTCE